MLIDLDNDIGKCSFKFSQTVVFVMAINVDSEAIFPRNDDDGLGNKINLGCKECSLTYLLLDSQLFG
jgi:hypothetical protein